MKTVIYNGKIYVDRGHFEQAVLISDGLFEKIGNNTEILAAAGADCKKIDAGGKTILPGLNDSHQHLGYVGEYLSLCDLSGARSIGEVVDCGRRFMQEHPEMVQSGMHGIRYNQDYFTDEKRVLNRHDLDRISTEIPIVFERACGHIVAANTRAIELRGITGKTPQFDGGVFDLGADGEPNGVFKENATGEIMKALSAPTIEQKEQMFLSAMRYATSVGLTSVQSNDVRDNDWKETFGLLHKLNDEGKMLVRYRHQCAFLKIDQFKEFLSTEYKNGKYDQTLAIGPLKLFKDGSLGARTALMRQEYKDDPGNFGVAALSFAQMEALCGLASENGMQVITHVIGDAAVEETINHYEKIIKGGKNTLRNGVVHCQITDLPMLQRIAQMGIVAIVQPIFLHYDMHVVESRVGKELSSTSYAFNTLAKLGAPVSYGSDAPVENCNPFPCIYCAVTRKDLEGYPKGGFYPQECVDVEQAIDHYTVGSAYAEFKEDVKGRIKPGQYADLIILDHDIFTIPTDEIRDITVELTMMGGKVVFQKS